MHRLRPLLASCAISLAGGACEREPQSFAECRDAPCRREWVARAWDADPSQVGPMLQGIADPPERAGLIDALVAAHPTRTRDLCDLTEPGVSRDWCIQVNGRPHLGWGEGTAPIDSPGWRDITPGPHLHSSLEGAPPQAGECSGRADATACQVGVAQDLAASGDALGASQRCSAIADPAWKGECHFLAAEAHIRAGRREVYPGAVDLCLLAEPFVGDCFFHLSDSLAEDAPSASRPKASEWSEVRGNADMLNAFWFEHDAEYGETVLQWFWSHAAAWSLAWAPTVNGNLRDVLPPEAGPHVRTAAAAAWLARRTSRPPKLDEAVAELAAQLDLRGNEAPLERPDWRGLAPRYNLWPKSQRGAAIAYLGVSRRALSTDLTLDLTLSLLEAAARLDPPAYNLLQQGMSHKDETVRTTVARLKRELAKAPRGDK